MRSSTADEPQQSDTIQSLKTVPSEDIQSLIKEIRGLYVMLDKDLAALYGVEAKVLNQAVKRNIERFPEDFRFQLTKEECLRSQIVTLNEKQGHHLKYMPYAFTEQGVAMLSSILHSKTAIEVNIRIIRAFVSLRHFMISHASVFNRLETIEFNQLEMQQHQQKADRRIDEVFRRLDAGNAKPQQGVFYDGQIYDAYVFVSNLIRSATRSILLIDNYVDESVLSLLDKRGSCVNATICTLKISKQLKLDIIRHNAQYEPIDIKAFNKSHDRFLCIDEDVYHIGASIKDLGKKWFAFSKLEVLTRNDLVNKLSEDKLR